MLSTIPVIVGVGEIVDRPKEIAEGLEPLLARASVEARRSGLRRRLTKWPQRG